ncbi:efflux RND transporter periplasmic adaptor subunit [Actinophytocola sp.]|uniref:efflux RND transporter periplasmic adaptor subunit n=1 Tax=Actinophytocola sp. TaxID=1872138 RepID=UPI002ED5C6E2
MGKARRRLLVLTGVVVVAAGGVAAWLVLRPAEAATQPVVATATVGTQRQTVSVSGTIEPADQADLNFAVNGKVTEVLVKEGDEVTAGQALATVDDTLLAAQLTAAQAQLDAAEEKAADSDDASADAAVVSAESNVTAAQEAVDNATLKSTINGTVVTVGLAVGDQVGSDNAGGGAEDSAQFTVVSTNRFVVTAKVGAEDVDKVKQGMAAEIVPTGGGETVAGTVQTVGLVASADDSGVATFPVTVAVTDERDDIYAGSSATVSIVLEERDNVLTIPGMALHTEGDSTYVNKIVNGQQVRTDVKVGDTFGGQTEIVSGLREGDQVEVAVAAPTGGAGGSDRTGGENVFPGGGGPGGGGPVMIQPGGGR